MSKETGFINNAKLVIIGITSQFREQYMLKQVVTLKPAIQITAERIVNEIKSNLDYTDVEQKHIV